MDTALIFPSKVDAWFVALFFCGAVAIAGGSIVAWRNKQRAIGAALGLIGAGFIFVARCVRRRRGSPSLASPPDFLLGLRGSQWVVCGTSGHGRQERSDDLERYYLTSVGSTTESAAIFDVFVRLKLITTEQHATAKGMLERIAAMLVKLAKAQEGE